MQALYTMNKNHCRVYNFTKVQTAEKAEEIKIECESLSSSNW